MNSEWESSFADSSGSPSDDPYRRDSPYGNAAGWEDNFNDTDSPGTPPPTTFSGVLINGFCFLLILLLVALIFLSQGVREEDGEKPSPQGELAELTIQAKCILGAKVLAESNPTLKEQLDEELPIRLGTSGSVRVRQAGAVMTAELSSTREAIAVLINLRIEAARSDYQLTDTEEKTTRILQELLQGSPEELDPEEQEHLREELLWFGELALHPAEPGQQDAPGPERQAILDDAFQTLLTAVGLGLLGFVALLVGLVGCGIMLVLYSNGRLKIRTPAVSPESSIYLESFTVWLLTFILYSLIIGLVAPQSNPLAANAVVFLASFITALLWSVVRGRFSRRFREDAGLTGNPLSEIPAAIWCYACTLPLLGLGMMASQLLANQFAEEAPADFSSTGPTHPLLEWVMDGDAPTIFLIFFVSCVCAPIVEETMFRGFLYRSLKDNSYRLGQFLSTLFAAVVNGLLFAAIHPQGIFLIPALCSLGIGFSLAREWRGTLWTPIFMHALHNGILTAALVSILAA